MDQADIEKWLDTAWAARRLFYYPRTDGSTNDIAKALAEQGAPHGTLVVTDEQAGGRGRNARLWCCPPGVNIAMSLVARPRLPLAAAPILTLAAGLSVAEGIAALLPADCATPVGLKWPNDVVIAKRKVCGILTESALAPDGSLQYCIVGIGINVLQRDFSPALAEIAGSVLSQTGVRIDRAALVARVCARIENNFAAVEETADFSLLKDAYETRLVNREKEVRVLDPLGEYTGVALGVDDGGLLRVRCADGKIVGVRSGEVSVRGLYHYTD